MKQGDEILTELKEMGSTLGDISKQMPFEIPDNYFHQLQHSVLNELVHHSVIINTLSKRTPYEYPEGYFETLPQNILNTLQKENKKKIRIINFNIGIKVRIAAAAILLFTIGIAVFQYLQYSNSMEHKFASIPENEIKEYTQQKMLDIPNMENIANASKNIPNELTDDEIKQYLNETGWE